jgi:uncharacterized membrane-anchored protein
MQEVVQVPCLATGHVSGEQTIPAFVDRRQAGGTRKEGGERRQFNDSRRTFRPEVIELAEAVDQYKLRHRRRFITFEELYDVIAELGYRK